MEETTTDAATQDPGVTPAETQPEEQPAEAVTTPDSEPTSTQDAPEPDAEATDNSSDADAFDYESWLSKKGIDPSTPEGKAAIAKSWREMEKKMHATSTKASELEKAALSTPLEVDTDNELVRQALQEASEVKTTLTIQQWKQEKGITPEQDQALGDYVTQNPNIGYLYRNGHITLDQLYGMSGVGQVDPSELKTQGKQEALEALANKQRATSVKGAATSSTVAAEDPILATLLSD